MISRGLPQGGVLSPFLWLLHFNDLPRLLEKSQMEWGMEIRDVPAKELLLGGGVTLSISYMGSRGGRLRRHALELAIIRGTS